MTLFVMTDLYSYVRTLFNISAWGTSLSKKPKYDKDVKDVAKDFTDFVDEIRVENSQSPMSMAERIEMERHLINKCHQGR